MAIEIRFGEGGMEPFVDGTADYEVFRQEVRYDQKEYIVWKGGDVHFSQDVEL